MIIINKPKLQLTKENALLSFPFAHDENEQVLWYQIPRSFQNYVVTERLDAALVGLLFLGLKTGSDIKVNGPVSSRLVYSINHYLINAIVLSNPSYKKIKVWAEELDDKDLNEKKIAGTGLSCGVDSFASYYDHVNSQEGYQIEYFTFFNVGSHGDFGGAASRNLYVKRLKRIQLFSRKVNKPLIEVDSNLSEILRLNFQRTHTIRSVSSVLLLQKLFKTFYYASSVRFDKFKLDRVRIAEFDLLTLQLLSTESTQFFSSAAQYTRVERISLISEEPDTYEHLDVCVNTRYTGNKINCSKCHKCVRTMIVLDLLGKLEKYSLVFEINEYRKNRNKYLGKLVFNNQKETLDYEVIALIKQSKFQLPIQSYYYGISTIFRFHKNQLKKKIKETIKLKTR